MTDIIKIKGQFFEVPLKRKGVVETVVSKADEMTSGEVFIAIMQAFICTCIGMTIAFLWIVWSSVITRGL